LKIIVIGAGDVGFEIALRLSREEHDIVVIDSDGYGEFVVAGRSISCWVQEDVVPKETEEQKLYDT